MTKKNKGFTLIELLVVIAIIGILSSVVLAALGNARERARNTRRVSDVGQVRNALELYFESKGSYPTTTSSLAPTYITQVPKDPLTNTDYAYAGLGGSQCTGYHVGATLEGADNARLTDGDADTAAATKCTGSADDFNGKAAACTGTSAASTGDPCYDQAS